MEQPLELLDFDPLFFILDKGRCQIMIVKKEDKYEYSGMWLKRENYKWDLCHANMGKSHLKEYVTNYDFTKDKEQALHFAWASGLKIPLTTEQMQLKNSNPDFHY